MSTIDDTEFTKMQGSEGEQSSFSDFQQWIDSLPEEERCEVEYVDQLLRFRNERRQLEVPDVDAEWEKWNSRGKKSLAHRPRLWYYAAAIVAVVSLVLGTWYFIGQRQSDELIVLDKSDAPQTIRLQSGNLDEEDLGKVDYLSFADKKAVTDEQTVLVPRGQNCTLLLPDSTEVHLNAESRLTFPTHFEGSERRVKLLGEAYFKVKADRKKPFVVTTEDIDVTVLGTEFNVKSYKGNSNVTLVKGSVCFSKSHEEAKETLKPGQCGFVNPSGVLQVGVGDVNASTMWMRNLFYFNDASITDVLQEIGRWYNAGVKVVNEQALKEKIHFSADRHDQLKDVLDALNQIQGARLSLEDGYIMVR